MIRALVFDSNKLIRWSLKEALTDEGFETDTVATAEEALSRIMKIPYSLIFYDLELIDKDSLRMLDQVNSTDYSTSLIVLTSRDKQQIEFLLRNLNVTSIIEKPYRIDTIKAIARDPSSSKIN